MRRETRDRLAKTCFRKGNRPLSGNFFVWENPYDVFGNDEVQKGFFNCFSFARLGTNRACMEMTFHTGWSSADQISDYNTSDLEIFYPNHNTTAFRVKKTSTHIKAPLTKFITIIYEFKYEGDEGMVIIHSLYPGKDVGPVRGDMTKKPLVFFDWSHPGETGNKK